MFGMENWEQAESATQKQAADLAWRREISTGEVRHLFAGDLLGPDPDAPFGTVDLEIPPFGSFTEPAPPWRGSLSLGPCA